MKNIIAVCENGWILIGVQAEETDTELCLKNSSVVRRWDNGKGIGGLAKEINKHEYTLDEIGDVNIFKRKILFTIPCEW